MQKNLYELIKEQDERIIQKVNFGIFFEPTLLYLALKKRTWDDRKPFLDPRDQRYNDEINFIVDEVWCIL